jgi:hypothetical protein
MCGGDNVESSEYGGHRDPFDSMGNEEDVQEDWYATCVTKMSHADETMRRDSTKLYVPLSPLVAVFA